MRPLEIAVPVLCAAWLLWHHPRPLAIRMVPALSLVITLIHFSVEGYRWQMIPVYLLTSLLTLSSLIKISSSGDWPAAASYLILRRAQYAAVILLALSTAFPVLLPVPRIPAPSGDHEVGTTIFELTDPSRKETYSGKDEPRRFMVQAWYPANITNTDIRAPWVPDAKVYAPAIATYIDLPPFFLDHLGLVQIPAYKDPKPAGSEDPFAVILFSHGWNGFNAQSTSQALELASHGYVVIGIQHTYGAVVTVFPDGTAAPNNPNALPSDADDPNYEVVARRLVNQWAGDMSFALDQFARLNKEAGSIFFQKLDMERVGVYGHSTGGGAAIQFCSTDARCKAILGMDPFMRPVSAEVIEGGVPQPSFFMFSQSWVDDTDSKNNRLFSQFRPHIADDKGVIEILGTKHYDFSGLPLLSPIAVSHRRAAVLRGTNGAPQLGLKGPLSGVKVTEIVNAYLLGFFEMTLNGGSSELFDGAFTDYSEVKELQ